MFRRFHWAAVMLWAVALVHLAFYFYWFFKATPMGSAEPNPPLMVLMVLSQGELNSPASLFGLGWIIQLLHQRRQP